MSGSEYSHLIAAKLEIEQLLERKSLGKTVRSGLQRALDSIQKALDWGEDELSSGSTDD